jgi:hypothetical protein
MKELAAFYFIFACCLGVGSWFFAVAEFIGALFLQSWAFRLGPRALVIEEQAECPNGLGTIARGETERLKYRVLGDKRCLFRRKHRLFEFRWNTPLEIKGTVAWSEGKLITSGRYPLGVMVFALAWLAGWTTAGILAIIKGHSSGIPFVALGWVFIGAIFIHSRWLELRRFKDYAAELKSVLKGNPFDIR